MLIILGILTLYSTVLRRVYCYCCCKTSEIYFALLVKLCFASVLYLLEQVLYHRRLLFSNPFSTRIRSYILMFLDFFFMRSSIKKACRRCRADTFFFMWIIFQGELLFLLKSELTAIAGRPCYTKM